MSYSYHRGIRVNPAQVPADLTDFPLLVTGTFPYLATVANGGQVQHASGFDIAFYADPALTIPLKFERVTWSATTGQAEFWVKLPMLSSFSYTFCYLAYGDATVAADQQNAANVWTNSFTGVFHQGDGTTLSAVDSSGLTTTGTITGAVAATGQVGGGGSFSAPASGDRIVTNHTVETDLATYSIWAKSSQTGEASGAPRLFCKGVDGAHGLGAPHMLIDQVDGSGAGLPPVASIVFYRSFTVSPGYWYITRPSNAWHRYDIAYDRRDLANDPIIYLDGISQAITEWGTPSGVHDDDDTVTGNLVIGNRGTTNDRAFGGLLDEFKVASVLRSPAWILASYNNESSPSTFYDIGPEPSSVYGSIAIPPRAFAAGLF